MEFSGRLLYANDIPAGGVTVRVFDEDVQETNDELTTAAGTTDEQGEFVVQYRPSRYRAWAGGGGGQPSGIVDVASPRQPSLIADLLDVYRPYLEFTYTHKGDPRRHTAFMVPFVRTFRLPDTLVPLTSFNPSEHGFKFVNRFKGFPLPISVPSVQKLLQVPDVYGLCGGMASAASDYYLSKRTVPSRAEAPLRQAALHKYLTRRQVDTFGAMGRYIAKFCAWMCLPDGETSGTQKRSFDEFMEFREQLDRGMPVVLGLVYVRASDTLKVWENHQVLAYAYEEMVPDGFRIRIYDPNHPQVDGIAIEAERVNLSSQYTPPMVGPQEPVCGLKCTHKIPNKPDKTVRGFFAMPYAPIEPPGGMR